MQKTSWYWTIRSNFIFKRSIYTTVSMVATEGNICGRNKWAVNVTQSDKKGGKYMCSLNNIYLKFSIRYYNSITFIKLSINFYISGKDFT